MENTQGRARMHTYMNDVRSRVHTPMHAQRANREKKRRLTPVWDICTRTRETTQNIEAEMQHRFPHTWTVSSITRESRVADTRNNVRLRIIQDFQVIRTIGV